MKTTVFLSSFLFLPVITLSAQNNAETDALTVPYFGQKPPGMVPGIFAPGIISTQNHEFSCCMSPDGKEFYFTRLNPEERQNYVMFTTLTDGRWTEPAVAPFAGPFTFEPFVTPDNKRVYFQTGKVTDGKLMMYTMYADKTENGWSEARDAGDAFNPMKTMHISATLDGTVYTTDISGGMGSEALGIVKKYNGEYKNLEKLGLPFNQTEKQQHPWIAPDESYIIFTVRKPGQDPVSVLLCSFKNKKGEWTEPIELKLGMDAGQPFVTRDRKYLFFSGGSPGRGDIFWVDAKIIEELKPEK